ncbi:crossover junction endonuclease EME1 [Schistosoma japonicum]|nr:crossover junction endonuclease EME1 [Schistosoma japonicum]
MIPCEFDENILQVSNLLASLTWRLKKKSVCKQLASLIQPKNVGVNGLSGSVPISYSVTWTHEWVEIMLDALIEPEVVILSQSSLSSINTSSHITCVTSNLHDVALFLNSITRSLAKRHFK